MSTGDHAAIDAVCDIIDRFPAGRRSDAIYRACFGTGKALDPTGLEPTHSRKIKHLVWDLTVDDLKQQMVKLVEEARLDEQLLVQGVVAFLDFWFADCANPDSVKRCRDNLLAVLEDFQEQFELLVDDRVGKLTDDELDQSIAQIRESISGGETRRLEAEKALVFFRRKAALTFTPQFWRDCLNKRLGGE